MRRRLGVAGLALVASLAAQPPAPPVLVAGEPGGAAFGRFEFIAAGAEPGGKVVKDAPYTAEGVTETVQVLGDGTRITRRSTRKFARDSQGRTREEATLPAIGPWASAAEAPRLVTIHDPVAGETWILNEKERTAERMPRITARTRPMADKAGAPKKEGARIQHDVVMIAGAAGVPAPPPAAAPVIQSFRTVHAERIGEGESLGEQVFDGIRATGTRFTHTIPAGEIGNDRALVTTVERWHSPELQVLVRSHTRDPQAGDTDYRLTNVRREEPDRSLFEIPADYTIRKTREAFFERRIEPEEEPAERKIERRP